jgi:hypothetical protein
VGFLSRENINILRIEIGLQKKNVVFSSHANEKILYINF